MILSKGIITPNGRDAWWDLLGLAVLIGERGLPIVLLGFNQYIIQRTLAAKAWKKVKKDVSLLF